MGGSKNPVRGKEGARACAYVVEISILSLLLCLLNIFSKLTIAGLIPDPFSPVELMNAKDGNSLMSTSWPPNIFFSRRFDDDGGSSNLLSW